MSKVEHEYKPFDLKAQQIVARKNLAESKAIAVGMLKMGCTRSGALPSLFWDVFRPGLFFWRHPFSAAKTKRNRIGLNFFILLIQEKFLLLENGAHHIKNAFGTWNHTVTEIGSVIRKKRTGFLKNISYV